MMVVRDEANLVVVSCCMYKLDKKIKEAWLCLISARAHRQQSMVSGEGISDSFKTALRIAH